MAAPVETLCMATEDASCNFKPKRMQRRPVGDHDVLIDIKYCGVCHSDLHNAAGHLSGISKVRYPMVPGHELAGECVAVGPKVTKVKAGQKVGVGCYIDSCHACSSCRAGKEQNCSKKVLTYNDKDKGSGRAESYAPGSQTLGGYTTKMVVDENFVIIIPDNYPLEYAGPVMCAGITMYDPMAEQGVKAGTKVGIVGLGGLGLMGVRIAKALGAEVTVISRNPKKEALAREYGADRFLLSKVKENMQAGAKSLDLILNTVPSYHPYWDYNILLKKTGRQVLLGLHRGMAGAMLVNKVTFNRSRLLHSEVGGIPATQAVIDLCAKHDIRPNIKIVPVHELNNVYELLDGANDEGLRYVLDIAGSLNDDAAAKCTHPPPKLSEFKDGISPGAAVREFLWLFFTFQWW